MDYYFCEDNIIIANEFENVAKLISYALETTIIKKHIELDKNLNPDKSYKIYDSDGELLLLSKEKRGSRQWLSLNEYCPYCFSKYGKNNVPTSTGNTFKNELISGCCHKCALEAGLNIC